MFQHFIELALSKASSSVESAALRPVLVAAISLDEEERTFGDRIDANKALRGETSTKLSKRKRSEVDGYTSDALKLEAQQLKEYSTFESSSSIIYCIKTALDGDVSFWSKAHEKCHSTDASIVQSFALAKAH